MHLLLITISNIHQDIIYIKKRSVFSLRLGSKLPPGVSQPPLFAKKPWETQTKRDLWSQDQSRPIGRPLDHVPHIRNPKLRQYYLQGNSAEFHHPTYREGCCHQATV